MRSGRGGQGRAGVMATWRGAALREKEREKERESNAMGWWVRIGSDWFTLEVATMIELFKRFFNSSEFRINAIDLLYFAVLLIDSDHLITF